MSKCLCIDARLLTAPGIGTYLKNILSFLKETPWKWYALIDSSQKEKMATWSHVEPIPLSSGIYSIREQLELPLKIPAVDLFWSPHYNVPCLPIRARKRLTCIHDVFHLAYASTLKPLERLYAKFMINRAVRLSDHVITCSDFSKKEIEKYTRAPRPISIIPYGVDPDVFQLKQEEHSREAFLKKYHIDSPFLLYVGSFKAHKNLHGLIAAFALLVRQGLDTHLVIVGGGEGMRHCDDVKQLCTFYPELKSKIHCVGRVPDEDLPHFYHNAQMFLFPSLYEGFGFPPLEAMSSGCPTIVSQEGALPETCGNAALYIDPRDPQQIAQKIAALLSNKEQARELVEKGTQRAKLFCWKRSAEKHWTLIEELMR